MTPWTILALTLAFILGFSLLTFTLSIIPPKTHLGTTPEDFGIPYKNVTFTTQDNYTLAGWLIGTNKSKPLILVSHGYPFDKTNIIHATHFLHPTFNLLIFDMRSFGDSEGIITTAGAKEVEDAKAAYQYAKKKGYTRIGAYGFSMSASMFLMADLNIPTVADSPYSSLHHMIAQTYRIFGPLKWPFVWVTTLYGRLFLGIDAKQVSPAEHIKTTTAPVLLIHGKHDSQIPVENSKRINANAGKNVELWIIAGEHGMSYATQPEKYKKRIRSFFTKHL